MINPFLQMDLPRELTELVRNKFLHTKPYYDILAGIERLESSGTKIEELCCTIEPLIWNKINWDALDKKPEKSYLEKLWIALQIGLQSECRKLNIL